MKDHLLQKYNVPVPRYTSYPPANYFTDSFSGEDYRKAVVASNAGQPRHLSFYLHIPFCRRLCHYCGCNAYPMRRQQEIERYVAALHTEIDQVKALLDPARKVAQIHYGGGTPTAIPARFLKELNEHLLEGFTCIDQPEIAIECHPGYPDERYWEDLVSAGFNRFSLGIQDFNEEVLAVANRKASLLPVDQIIGILRKNGAKINMDFIYGLPRQTVESFSASIRQAIALAPDRIVTFSYAHVPWVNQQQLILEKAGLPESKVKSGMYEAARQLFLDAGYEAIGLDHFVRKDDEFYTALSEGRLHRNFQGYCTRRTTGQVYAFGATGISQLSDAYSQNTKDLDQYMETVGKGEFPVVKGYRLNRKEQVIREVIETLMCNYSIDWGEIAERLSLPEGEVKASILYQEERLKELEADGLIVCKEAGLSVSDTGRLFVRNIAAALDPLMLHSDKNFSKPV